MDTNNQNPASPALAVTPRSALDVAQENLMRALSEYAALAPESKRPSGPLEIIPKLRHADEGSFVRGCNMMLDAGGYMPGKIPVIVVPARPKDIRRYARKRTVKGLLAALGVHLPNSRNQPTP